MKIRMTRCDLCGMDELIPWNNHGKIKVKVSKYHNEYSNYDDFEFRKWTRLDICPSCMERLVNFCRLCRDKGA